MNNDDLLIGLTKEQKEAVTYRDGPVLVVAGAGTGKTGVITRRIAWLIKNGTLPEEILALTFTEKAAIEMEERVDTLVPYGFIDTWISTFHAFGDRVLREHAIELDLPVDFRVLTDPEKMILFKDHLFELPLKKLRPLGNPTRYLNDLLKLFSKIKDEDIAANDYIKQSKKLCEKAQTAEDSDSAEIQLEIALCYKEFNDMMHSEGFIDFGDQISLCLRLFRENPRILKIYQQKFKYILVDEFQDTNFAQNELLKILAPHDANLMVVGDDDQSIYRFRGAAISNILGFLSVWKDAKQIVLTKNFRSTTPILAASYRLVTQNNPERLEVKNQIDKRLSAAGENKKQEGRVEWHFSQTKSGEADWVAKKIKEVVKSGKRYKDIAILVRKNSDAEVFQRALNSKSIPYKFSGEAGLYTRPEVIDLISFISVLCDPEDAMAFFHLATGDIYQISTQAAIAANSEMKRRSVGPEVVYADFIRGSNQQIGTTDKEKLEVLMMDIADYRGMMSELTSGQLVYRFLTETGYLKKLLRESNKSAEAEIKIQNIAKFFEKIKDFDNISSDKSLLKFYEDLNLLVQAGENPATAEIDPDLDAVNILTVHKSKGLEFPIVFMVNLVAGNFPQRNRSDVFEIPRSLFREQLPEGDQHLAEERRLFYVGMTRAQNELYLSSAEDHGGARRQKVSQFVIEATGEVTEYKEKYKQNVEEKLACFEVGTDLKKLLLGFYEEGKTLVLTPHQIDDYISCPLKFKYVHIFKLPLMRRHEIIYGSAVHAAVQYYFEAKKRDKKVTASDLEKVFEKSWVPEGFVTQKHERERFTRGKQTLKKFWERQEATSILPSLVEEPFSFVLGGGESRTKINGRYDAVFDLGGEIEIRDFKTSDVRKQEDATRRAKDNRQISIYALSWRANHGNIPKSVSLDFVESGLIGEVEKTEKDLSKTEAEIEKVSLGIRRADFVADPGWGECARCAYRTFCPFKK